MSRLLRPSLPNSEQEYISLVRIECGDIFKRRQPQARLTWLYEERVHLIVNLADDSRVKVESYYSRFNSH